MENTIVVVEDDPVSRGRLSQAIQCRVDLRLACAVGTCKEGRAALQRERPRVLLTDLGLPDGSGIELIREASRLGGMDSMVVTIFGDEKNVVAALEAGATGYLLKDSGPEEIGEAVVGLINGGSPISAKIARYLVKRFQSSGLGSTHPINEGADLTEREREVLERMAKGFSYAEVAQTLEMSPNTVTSHIKNIYRKLAVHSRSEAVFEAAQRGLIRLTR